MYQYRSSSVAFIRVISCCSKRRRMVGMMPRGCQIGASCHHAGPPGSRSIQSAIGRLLPCGMALGIEVREHAGVYFAPRPIGRPSDRIERRRTEGDDAAQIGDVPLGPLVLAREREPAELPSHGRASVVSGSPAVRRAWSAAVIPASSQRNARLVWLRARYCTASVIARCAWVSAERSWMISSESGIEEPVLPVRVFVA